MADQRSATNAKQHTLYLGNPNPHHQFFVDDGTDEAGNPKFRQEGRPHPFLQQSVTTVELWDGVHDPKAVEHTLSTDNDRALRGVAAQLKPAQKRYAVAVYEVEELLAYHSGGAAPDWVDGADKALVKAVADYFGCPVGEPTALLTNGGRDKLHDAYMTTSTQPAAFNYMAITTDATAAAAGDTTLTSEETTNGLARAQATYAHTAGTNTSTLTKTWTYTGASSKVLAKIGVFNASSAGTMGYETVLNATATVSVSGDSVTVTDTPTIG